MIRRTTLLAVLALGLAACTPVPDSTTTTTSASGSGAPKLYRIKQSDVGKLQFRMLDSVNALRQRSGSGPVELNAQLNAAAATHARDMSLQNRPWHFGSDGSSPIDRVQRVGYRGTLVGENISETYETELQTLAAWMEQPDTRRTIMSRDARDMGFSWFQEPNGKIWWVMVMGNSNAAPIIPDSNPSASRLVPSDLSEQTPSDDENSPVVTIISDPAA